MDSFQFSSGQYLVRTKTGLNPTMDSFQCSATLFDEMLDLIESLNPTMDSFQYNKSIRNNTGNNKVSIPLWIHFNECLFTYLTIPNKSSLNPTMDSFQYVYRNEGMEGRNWMSQSHYGFISIEVMSFCSDDDSQLSQSHYGFISICCIRISIRCRNQSLNPTMDSFQFCRKN